MLCEEHGQAYGSSKVKVTILASEWGSSKGGLSTINRELAIQLAKFPEVEITFFLPQCSEQDKKEALSHNVNIVEAKRRSGYKELEWLSFPPQHLQIDVIVGHGVKLGRQAQVIRDSHNCKWVQVVHTDPEELGMFKCYSNPISKGEEKHKVEVELCEMANCVIGVGPKLTEAFRSYLRGCQKDRTIHNFTPGVFDEFVSVQQVPFEREHFCMLVFGRGDAEDFELKGFDVAAKAVASLNDTCLMFVGAPEGKNDEIKKRLLDSGISASRLRVRGYVSSRESLKDLFFEVDMVLMPSRTEGFGLTGLEALSAGLPVLVSKNSGFGEALSKVRFGSYFVIDSEDPKVWATTIRDISRKDRKERLEEAELLRSLYAKKYSWTKQSKDLLEKMITMVHGSSSSCESLTPSAGELSSPPFQRTDVTTEHFTASSSSSHRSAHGAVPPRLPMRIDGEIVSQNAHIDITTQQVFNKIADRYLETVQPSTREEHKEFVCYLQEVKKTLIVRVGSGSLIITLECSSLKILEGLWKDYCSGHLNEMAQKCLVTEEILRECGLLEVKLTTTILEKDYRACREFFIGIAFLAGRHDPDTRQWLFEDFYKWFSDPGDSRAYILLGDAGVGKSVMAGVLAQRTRKAGHLGAAYFCRHNDATRNDPRYLLGTVASQLCDCNSQYSNIVGGEGGVRMMLANPKLGVQELFTKLLEEPLIKCSPCQQRKLVIIDALDETEYESREDFLDLIKERFPQLPKWLVFFITSRPEDTVQNRLERYNPCVRICAGNTEQHSFYQRHEHDIKRFLEKRIDFSRVPYSVEDIAKTCNGLFLYAFYVVNVLNDPAQSGKIDNLDDLLPGNMEDFFRKNFQRVFDKVGEDLYRKLFGCVLVAPFPLPVSFISFVLNREGSDHDEQEVIDAVSQFVVLRTSDRAVTFLHSLIPAWLTNKRKARTLFIEKTIASEYLKTIFIKILSAVVEEPPPASIADMDLRDYVSRVAVRFLCQHGDKDSLKEVFRCLTSYRYLEKRIQSARLEIYNLLEDLKLAAGCLTEEEAQKQTILQEIFLALETNVHVLLECPHLLNACIGNASNVVQDNILIPQLSAPWLDLNICYLQICNDAEMISGFNCFASASDKKTVAMARGCCLLFVDASTLKAIGGPFEVSQDATTEINHLEFSPDDKFLFFGRLDKWFSVERGCVEDLSQFSDNSIFYEWGLFTPDGQYIVVKRMNVFDFPPTCEGKCCVADLLALWAVLEIKQSRDDEMTCSFSQLSRVIARIATTLGRQTKRLLEVLHFDPEFYQTLVTFVPSDPSCCYCSKLKDLTKSHQEASLETVRQVIIDLYPHIFRYQVWNFQTGKPLLQEVFHLGVQLNSFAYFCHVTSAFDMWAKKMGCIGTDKAVSVCNIAVVNAVYALCKLERERKERPLQYLLPRLFWRLLTLLEKNRWQMEKLMQVGKLMQVEELWPVKELRRVEELMQVEVLRQVEELWQVEWLWPERKRMLVESIRMQEGFHELFGRWMQELMQKQVQTQIQERVLLQVEEQVQVLVQKRLAYLQDRAQALEIVQDEKAQEMVRTHLRLQEQKRVLVEKLVQQAQNLLGEVLGKWVQQLLQELLQKELQSWLQKRVRELVRVLVQVLVKERVWAMQKLGWLFEELGPKLVRVKDLCEELMEDLVRVIEHEMEEKEEVQELLEMQVREFMQVGVLGQDKVCFEGFELMLEQEQVRLIVEEVVWGMKMKGWRIFASLFCDSFKYGISRNIPKGFSRKFFFGKGTLAEAVFVLSPERKWVVQSRDFREVHFLKSGIQEKDIGNYSYGKEKHTITHVDRYTFTNDDLYVVFMSVRGSLHALSLQTGTVFTSVSGCNLFHFTREGQVGYLFRSGAEEKAILLSDLFSPFKFFPCLPVKISAVSKSIAMIFTSSHTVMSVSSDAMLAKWSTWSTTNERKGFSFQFISESSLIGTVSQASRVKDYALSPDGKLIAFHQETKIVLHSLLESEEFHCTVFKAVAGFANVCLTFSADSSLLLCCILESVNDPHFYVWNVQEKVMSTSFKSPSLGLMAVECFCLSSDNRELILCGEYEIEIWEYDKHPRRLLTRSGIGKTYNSVKFSQCAVSSDNELLFCCVANIIILFSLRVPDVHSSKQILRGHLGKIEFCKFLKVSRYLVSYGVDGMVFLWDVIKSKAVGFVRVAQRQENIVSMAVSPEEDRVVCFTSSGRVCEIKLCKLENVLPWKFLVRPTKGKVNTAATSVQLEGKIGSGCDLLPSPVEKDMAEAFRSFDLEEQYLLTPDDLLDSDESDSD